MKKTNLCKCYSKSQSEIILKPFNFKLNNLCLKYSVLFLMIYLKFESKIEFILFNKI